MAERRMFSKLVIDSDEFLEMPLTTQAIYMHLAMRADDDGFVTPKKIIRMLGAREDELKLLIAKHFIIPFESGVIVIRHWKLNNYLRSDRYKETIFKEEKSQLIEATKGVYEKADVIGIPNGYQMDTQVRLGKDSIDNIYTNSSLHSELVCSEISSDISKPTESSSQSVNKDDVFIVMPLDGTPKEVAITYSYLNEKQKIYSGIDVFLETQKAVDWCKDNPANKKTITGYKSFLTRWFNKAQNGFYKYSNSNNYTKYNQPQTIPSKPKEKGWEEMTAEEQKAHLEEMEKMFNNMGV